MNSTCFIKLLYTYTVALHNSALPSCHSFYHSFNTTRHVSADITEKRTLYSYNVKLHAITFHTPVHVGLEHTTAVDILDHDASHSQWGLHCGSLVSVSVLLLEYITLHGAIWRDTVRGGSVAL